MLLNNKMYPVNNNALQLPPPLHPDQAHTITPLKYDSKRDLYYIEDSIEENMPEKKDSYNYSTSPFADASVKNDDKCITPTLPMQTIVPAISCVPQLYHVHIINYQTNHVEGKKIFYTHDDAYSHVKEIEDKYRGFKYGIVSYNEKINCPCNACSKS